MRLLLLFLFALSFHSWGQSEHILVLGSGTSPKASIQDLQWIAGHWRGEAFGGQTEEIWSPPLGGSMMCVFRLINNGQVSFYEIVSLAEENSSLIIRLKHFHRDLKGWEEKDKTVDFPLVKIEGTRAYFDGMTFEQINKDELNVYVMIGKAGEEKEVLFKYFRVKP